MTKEITDKDYSKTVDEMIINDKYKSDYLDKYYEIKYVDDKLFIDNINTLIEKEYSTDLINSAENIEDLYHDVFHLRISRQ